jgi:hypothetical protein
MLLKVAVPEEKAVNDYYESLIVTDPTVVEVGPAVVDLDDLIWEAIKDVDDSTEDAKEASRPDVTNEVGTESEVRVPPLCETCDVPTKQPLTYIKVETK